MDQYCIDQDDANEKHNQIVQMDKIYSEASLTIIAAAGDGADYGLPGVSIRPRSPLPQVQLHGLALRSTTTYPHDLVESSKWASRGWTFQEALLSKRHLYFTEEQVFFKCPCFFSCESVNTTDVDLRGTTLQSLNNVNDISNYHAADQATSECATGIECDPT